MGRLGTFLKPNAIDRSCTADCLPQPADAHPHHVVFIADPQLVDPHTYPGRPWPLSSLTVYYTDLYIRKSFEKITKVLSPDTIFFLGDLFDGGREWSNDPTYGVGAAEIESNEEEWRTYRQQYWLQEYYRFGRIFFDTWLRSRQQSSRQQRARLIVDLPGNHDLGLGDGIRLPARRRFNAFFGEGNRVDVIGNHTFVSLDTVSLSGKGQIAPETGTQGVHDETHTKAVWEPVDEFLHSVDALKARSIERTIRTQNGLPEFELQDIEVYDLEDPLSRELTLQPKTETDFPSVVLSHIPFFRPPGTPCGPLRERFPPSKTSKNGEALEQDDRNAIPYQAGKQYQNVLTAPVTNEIVDLVSGISHVFSGDDHDYCDILHREFTSKNGGIREITVKSISWAMGVRRPGFLLASLWNPVDANGRARGSDAAKHGTLQTHLCLLPDQLSIFINYGLLVMFTTMILLLHAVRTADGRQSPRRNRSESQHLLPMSRSQSSDQDTSHRRSDTHLSAHSFSSSSSDIQSGLAPRAAVGRNSRSTSPGYGIPQDQTSTYKDKVAWNEIDLGEDNSSGRSRTGKGTLGVFVTFQRNLIQVATVVMIWYVYILWST